MQQLAAQQAKFEQNVMDATDAFEHRETDRAALAGLPQFVLERAAALATERGFEGWCLRLDPPTYQTVMAHAESAALREKYYQAWVTRASDQGPHAGRWDNGALIEEILALRHEAAQLVGFKTFAEFSLATKMAESPRASSSSCAISRSAAAPSRAKSSRCSRTMPAASSKRGTSRSTPSA